MAPLVSVNGLINHEIRHCSSQEPLSFSSDAAGTAGEVEGVWRRKRKREGYGVVCLHGVEL